MPRFSEPKGPHAHLARHDRGYDAPKEQTPSKPAAPEHEPRPDWIGPTRNSERDPKWFKRIRELGEVCEEIWPGRGLWQIQMGGNLWPRLADASAETSDEIWEHALDQLRGLERIPRVLCTYVAAMLERFARDPPRHIKQRVADESIPTLVVTPDRPWVVAAEARLAEKVKRALASSRGAGRDNGSVQTGRLEGLPTAQANSGATPQGEATHDPPSGVHGPGERPVVRDRR